MTNNLMVAVFDKEYMATNSLTGVQPNKHTKLKQAIDQAKLAQIIGKCG
jgi:hypothetical protein